MTTLTSLITDHTWRPPRTNVAHDLPVVERPCAYLNCGRPRAEHTRRRRTRSGAELPPERQNH